MASIKVTPETLSSQGADLNGYAEDLTGILNNIDAKIQEIDGEWDGAAQEGYIAMYEELKVSLNQFPELVATLGNATISAAEAFDELDTQLEGNFNSALS